MRRSDGVVTEARRNVDNVKTKMLNHDTLQFSRSHRSHNKYIKIQSFSSRTNNVGPVLSRITFREYITLH